MNKIIPSEDFDFDSEYVADMSDIMQPVNENGYPFSPSTVNSASGQYNWGFEYKICPLSFNLQQKGNDKLLAKYNKQFVKNKVYVGNIVSGISPKDNKKHYGRIVNFTFTDSSSRELMYVWILDRKTMTRIYLEPDSVELITPEIKNNHKRFSPFATNYMKCHESLDLFANDDTNDSVKYSSNDSIYRAHVINELEMKERYVKYFDDKFSGVFKYSTIRLMEFETSDFCNCVSVNQKKDPAWTKKMIEMFIGTYLTLASRSEFKYRLSIKELTTYIYNENYAHNFEIESWEDVYYVVEALKRCFRYTRNTEHYVPKVSGTNRIWWNNNVHTKGYRTMLKKFVIHNLMSAREYYPDGRSADTPPLYTSDQ